MWQIRHICGGCQGVRRVLEDRLGQVCVANSPHPVMDGRDLADSGGQAGADMWREHHI